MLFFEHLLETKHEMPNRENRHHHINYNSNQKYPRGNTSYTVCVIQYCPRNNYKQYKHNTTYDPKNSSFLRHSSLQFRIELNKPTLGISQHHTFVKQKKIPMGAECVHGDFVFCSILCRIFDEVYQLSRGLDGQILAVGCREHYPCNAKTKSLIFCNV